MGFSVTGRVLNSPDGEGVPDATVYLNNQIKGNHKRRLVFSVEYRTIVFEVVLCHTLNCSLLYHSVLTVVSKEDGSFRLENMTAGTYTIRVNKELMFFEPVTVKIAPNTPQLPDIVTAGYVIRIRSLLHKFICSVVLHVVMTSSFWSNTGSVFVARSPSAACLKA